MKTVIVVLSTVCFLVSGQGLPDLIGSDTYRCIECLCHARTGCYRRTNCASYSIDMDYWRRANSPTVLVDDDPTSEQSFRKCMNQENCIINTISNYIQAIGQVDCNCDGKFDCKDWLAIHLFGGGCINPNFGSVYASRFNDCAKSRSLGVTLMEKREGAETCTVDSA